jgi:hypothetical protein
MFVVVVCGAFKCVATREKVIITHKLQNDVFTTFF